MKHNFKVIILLVSMFLIAQLIGLYVVKSFITENLPFNIERPKFERETSFIPIFFIILVATAIALVLARLNAIKLWKFWFFISIVLVLCISLSAFMNQYLAGALAIIAAFFKIIKPNVYIHNISELFIYGGLAAMFVPILSIFSVSILMILIAVYDAIAVWKTKHMIKLAEFQSKLKIFTGFLVPYKTGNKLKTAILGGGDIGFPLLFTGVIFLERGLISLVIPIVVSLSLFLLLYFGEKNKFYPAMPFLSIGCFIGYGLILLNTL